MLDHALHRGLCTRPPSHPCARRPALHAGRHHRRALAGGGAAAWPPAAAGSAAGAAPEGSGRLPLSAEEGTPLAAAGVAREGALGRAAAAGGLRRRRVGRARHAPRIGGGRLRRVRVCGREQALQGGDLGRPARRLERYVVPETARDRPRLPGSSADFAGGWKRHLPHTSARARAPPGGGGGGGGGGFGARTSGCRAHLEQPASGSTTVTSPSRTAHTLPHCRCCTSWNKPAGTFKFKRPVPLPSGVEARGPRTVVDLPDKRECYWQSSPCEL